MNLGLLAVPPYVSNASAFSVEKSGLFPDLYSLGIRQTILRAGRKHIAVYLGLNASIVGDDHNGLITTIGAESDNLTEMHICDSVNLFSNASSALSKSPILFNLASGNRILR